MINPKILSDIEAHPALRHTVFQTLAARMYPPEVLTNYLVNMATFCAASRWPGTMFQEFDAVKCRHACDAIDKILASEQGHEAQLQAMGALLIGSTHLEPLNRLDEDDIYERITDGTHDAIGTLTLRETDSWDDALYALGGMLAVEIVANRQIIPGQVAAFIDSDFYGLTLDDVPYLKEHAGEHGAEHDHEATMITVVGNFLPDDQARVAEGATEMLNSLEGFYDDLEAIFKDGNPA